MHPDDVREILEAEVARLEIEVERYPELNVVDVEFVYPTLQVRFQKTVRPVASADVPADIQVPGVPRVMKTFVGVDLSQSEQRELRLLMDCHNHDGQPPTAELRDRHGEPLPDNQWPRDLGGQGVIFGFEKYGRPFFCRRGLREFHDHPQHEDDPWDKHREGLPLHRIVLELLDDLAHRWVIEA